MWIWDSEFRAHKRHEDGRVTEKVFTSHAQARQFVEKTEDVKLAVKPALPSRRRNQHKIGRHVTAPASLTPEQKRLKEEAMKQFKGLEVKAV